MKKRLAFLVLVVFLVTFLGSSVSLADGFTLRDYSYTSKIEKRLSFSGGIAHCWGRVTPIGNYSASVTIYLYKQNGSSWTYLDSWSGSATGGNPAEATGATYVGYGTFKLVVKGNIGGGLEYPTTSVITIN